MVNEIIETIASAGAGKGINIAEDYIASLTGMPLSPWISFIGGGALIAYAKYKAKKKMKNMAMIAGSTAVINKVIDLITGMVAVPVAVPLKAGLAPAKALPSRGRYIGMVD